MGRRSSKAKAVILQKNNAQHILVLVFNISAAFVFVPTVLPLFGRVNVFVFEVFALPLTNIFLATTTEERYGLVFVLRFRFEF